MAPLGRASPSDIALRPCSLRCAATSAVLLAALAACRSHARPPRPAGGAEAPVTSSRPLAQLAGKRVLAILIPESDPRQAYFIAGPASWTGTVLEVRADSATTVTIPGGEGVAPSMLSNVIVPEHLARVQAVAQGADAVVAAFTTQPLPASALRLEMAFFGLLREASGAALLVVGAP